MNTVSFYEFRSKQTGSGSRSYIFRENKIISLTNLFEQEVKNFSEEKLNFYHHIIERNAQMHMRSENLFYQTNLLIDFKI